jgi:protein-S-isoprenylcysteine O-methyltransferase Ste14
MTCDDRLDASMWRRHAPLIVNLLLFGGLGLAMGLRAWDALVKEKFDFVEAMFSIHNIVFLVVILSRRNHLVIDRSIPHQMVALVAFFSGVAFDPKVTTTNPSLILAAKATVVASILLGIVTFINLGRSFGILIALRRVKTGGLYGIVRHPMYATDILWRISFLLNNPSAPNVVIFGASTAAYVWRALLEEKFLGRYEEYREYAQRVRYRFVPGVF